MYLLHLTAKESDVLVICTRSLRGMRPVNESLVSVFGIDINNRSQAVVLVSEQVHPYSHANRRIKSGIYVKSLCGRWRSHVFVRMHPSYVHLLECRAALPAAGEELNPIYSASSIVECCLLLVASTNTSASVCVRVMCTCLRVCRSPLACPCHP